MKIKLVNSIVLAVAVVLAATGCKHKPVGVTPIPHGPQPYVSDNNNNPNTLPPPPAYNPNLGNPTGTPIAETGGGWDIGNYNQDHDALAAYTIHFAYDSAVIRDGEKGSLQSVASALSDPSAKLLIEGNCDERGTEEYNRSLGERRALAAREALAGLGVDPNKIRTISYGKDKPADPGHDEAAWSKNRRDDFVLLKPKS